MATPLKIDVLLHGKEIPNCLVWVHTPDPILVMFEGILPASGRYTYIPKGPARFEIDTPDGQHHTVRAHSYALEKHPDRLILE